MHPREMVLLQVSNTGKKYMNLLDDTSELKPTDALHEILFEYVNIVRAIMAIMRDPAELKKLSKQEQDELTFYKAFGFYNVAMLFEHLISNKTFKTHSTYYYDLMYMSFIKAHDNVVLVEKMNELEELKKTIEKDSKEKLSRYYHHLFIQPKKQLQVNSQYGYSPSGRPFIS